MVIYCFLEFCEGAISIAEIAIGTSFSGPVADFLGNVQVLVVVIYCFLEFAGGVISIAEIGIGISFSGPVVDFLGNAQVLVVVIYCSLEVAVIRFGFWKMLFEVIYIF